MKRGGLGTNLLLLVMLSGLCAFTAYQWFNPPQFVEKPLDIPDLSSDVPTGANENAEEYFKTAAQEAYSEIIERPLFLATRRPPPPEPEVVTPIEDPPEEPEINISLIGVMVTPQATTVLLKDDDEGKVVPIKLGETIKNWQLETVQPERIVLRKNDDTKELLLVRNKRKAKRVQKKEREGKRKDKLKERRLAAQKRRAEKRRKKVRGEESDAEADTEAEAEAENETEAEETEGGLRELSRSM